MGVAEDECGEATGRVSRMTLALTLLETELPFPPFVFGLIAFGLLNLLLIITVTLGKGRPHS